MENKRFSVQHWYPDAKGWSEYFESESIAAATAALASSNPPEMQPGDYDYIMRHVRRTNRRRIYDTLDQKTIAEIEPSPWVVWSHKLTLWTGYAVISAFVFFIVLGTILSIAGTLWEAIGW